MKAVCAEADVLLDGADELMPSQRQIRAAIARRNPYSRSFSPFGTLEMATIDNG